MTSTPITDDTPNPAEGDYFQGFTVTSDEVETIGNYRDVARSRGFDVLVGYLIDRNRSLVSLRQQYDAVRAESITRRDALRAFQEKVIRCIVDFDGGCIAGKTDFLQSLGLDYPTTTWNVRVSWTDELPEGDEDETPDEDSIAYAVENAVDNAGDVSVEVWAD